MTNYIIISHLTSRDDAALFDKEIKSRFPRHKEENTDEIRYFGFAARNRADVEDQLQEILHNIGIGNEDYVALYYAKEENPDKITRVMVLGHDELIETDIQKIKPEDHVDTLSRLLNFDFVKAMPNP